MMENTFNDILRMVIDACEHNFYNDREDKEQIIIECATKIYIAQMKGGAE